MKSILVCDASGIGGALAARLMAELAIRCAEAKVVVIDDLSQLTGTSEGLEKLKDALTGAGEEARVFGTGIRGFDVPLWELKSLSVAAPVGYLLEVPNRQEVKQLRHQSRHQMAQKQQSLVAKARRR